MSMECTTFQYIMIIFSLPLLYSPFISPSKHMVRKNNDNVNVYMQKIKKCKNKLEAVGVFMEDEKLLHIILDGLPHDGFSFLFFFFSLT